MSTLSLNFSEVKAPNTRPAKKLLYKGENGTYFAAKDMSKRAAKQLLDDDLRFFRGIEGHENIVRCFVHCTFKEESVTKLMEVGDGNLEEFISDRDILPLKQLYSEDQQTIKATKHFRDHSCNDLPLRLDLLLQTAQGLKYLHDNRIIHRNIQPSNVLLIRTSQNKTVAKLGGFQHSRKWTGKTRLQDSELVEIFSNGITAETKAAQMYMSNECHKGKWSRASDIFAFGILIYYTLTAKHRHPFYTGQGKIDIETAKENIKGKVEAVVDFQQLASRTDEEKFSQKSMIEQVIDHDPAKRLKIDDVLYHPAFYTSQRKLDFLLTVRESLEKFYRPDKKTELAKKFDSLNEKIEEEIGEEKFNIDRTFQNHKYFTKPLTKEEIEKRKTKKYKGGWEPIEKRKFSNAKLVLRALRNNLAHACDINTPDDFKKDFGVNLDSYEAAKFFEIFVAKHNPKLLIGLYNAYKNNDQKCAAKFYPKLN